MGYALGVDCALDVRALSPTDATLSVWECICRWLGGKPAFIARYTGTGGGAATPLSDTEIDFIVVQQGVPLLPVFNDSPINGGTLGNAAQGTMDARMGLLWASQHGQPANTYLAFDVEASAQVQADYVQQLASNMRSSALAGSGVLYGNSGSAGNLGAALAAASADPNVARVLIWAAAWYNRPVDGVPGPVPVDGISLAAAAGLLAQLGWRAPAPIPPLAPNVRLWQFAAGCFGGLCDLDYIDEALLQTQADGNLWLPPAAQNAATATTPSTPATQPTQTTHPTSVALAAQAVQQVADLSQTLAQLRSAVGG
jgi:hypothetical protein